MTVTSHVGTSGLPAGLLALVFTVASWGGMTLSMQGAVPFPLAFGVVYGACVLAGWMAARSAGDSLDIGDAVVRGGWLIAATVSGLAPEVALVAIDRSGRTPESVLTALGMAASFPGTAFLLGRWLPRREAGPVPTAWTPPEDLPGHGGRVLLRDRVFFAPPPPDIGPVLSAHSTLRLGDGPSSRAQRLALCGVATTGIVVVWCTTVDWLGLGSLDTAVTGVLAVLGFTGVWLAGRFHARCSFIGPRGCCILAVGPDCAVRQVRGFRYGEANGVARERTAVHRHGTYAYTTRSDRYFDRANREVFAAGSVYGVGERFLNDEEAFADGVLTAYEAYWRRRRALRR